MRNPRGAYVAAALLAACVAIPDTVTSITTGAQGGGASGASGGASNGGKAGTQTGGSTSSSAGEGSSAAGETSSGGSSGGSSTTAGAGGDGASPSNIAGHPTPGFDYPVRDGFTLALVEEFNAPLDLVNDPIWTYSDGAEAEGDARYVKNGITFSGGSMYITVDDVAAAQSFSFAEDASVFSKSLSSGELRTKYNNYRYGRYEVRLKSPYPGAGTVDGNFINGFLVSRAPEVQEWRVISVELLGSSAADLFTTVYYTDQDTWTNDIYEGEDTFPAGAGAGPLPVGFDSRAEFHVYAFEWTPDAVRWYVDGDLIRVKEDNIGDHNLPVPELSAKIRMNLWVFNGSEYGGDPSNNQYSFAAEFDWFRFYRLDSEADYPCSPTPGCLDPDDLDAAANNGEENLE